MLGQLGWLDRVGLRKNLGLREICGSFKKMLWFLSLILFLNQGDGRLQCKNANNQVIDWFVGYKLPKDETSKNNFIRNGVGFAYISSDDVKKGWVLAGKSINASDNLIGYTMQPLYGDQFNKDFLWILYNDETPNKTVSFDLGHTKGVILSNGEEGFWLVHSVPRFPPVPSVKFSYPKSGIRNGQSFLCISMHSSEMDKVGHQLRYNEPQIYSSFVPSNLEKMFPNLFSAIARSWVRSPPWNNIQTFSGSGGMLFNSFAKSKKFNKDLYADWVAPVLKEDLMVETWPNGHGRLPSACQYPYKVFNIQSIQLKKYDIAFSNHLDHSKWSISVNSTNPWICIGDINRMETQERRSGGTVCMKQTSIWSAYKRTINEIESCPH